MRPAAEGVIGSKLMYAYNWRQRNIELLFNDSNPYYCLLFYYMSDYLLTVNTTTARFPIFILPLRIILQRVPGCKTKCS
jgi:hypothetical protein